MRNQFDVDKKFVFITMICNVNVMVVVLTPKDIFIEDNSAQ